VTIGRDLAGVVEAVGGDVTRFRPGDEVFGFMGVGPAFRDGTFTDYVVVPEHSIAAKPASLDFVHAAALPLAGLTALAAVEAVNPQPGKPVLIVGASGGVGGYAVQLAAARGATVIATVLPEDAERLRSLGAAEVVDYRHDLVPTVRERYPEGIAGLIDLANYAEGFAAVADLVAKGGAAATALGAADADSLAAKGVTATNLYAVPAAENLARLAAWADDGTLRVTVQQVYRLEDFLEGLNTFWSGHVSGKVAITLA